MQTPNPPRLARTRARDAREIIKEFSLGFARRYHADHADIGAGLVGAAIGQR